MSRGGERSIEKRPVSRLREGRSLATVRRALSKERSLDGASQALITPQARSLCGSLSLGAVLAGPHDVTLTNSGPRYTALGML